MLTFNEFKHDIDEELSAAERRKKGQKMRRMKGKLKIARKKASRRTASSDTLKKRSARKARGDMAKKLMKGKSKSDLSISQRKSVERRLDRLKSRIGNMAKRGVKDARKRDRG